MLIKVRLQSHLEFNFFRTFFTALVYKAGSKIMKDAKMSSFYVTKGLAFFSVDVLWDEQLTSYFYS